MKWWSRFEMWTLCSYNISVSVIVIITDSEDYLCSTHIYRIFCHVTLHKTRFKIVLMVYTFVLLLDEEDVLYHIHICFIFYAPGSKDRGHIVFVLSVCLFVCLFVCLSVVNFNLGYNFRTVRDRDFIFGMHTPLMMPFQMTPSSMTLWPWLWPWS